MTGWLIITLLFIGWLLGLYTVGFVFAWNR